MTKFFNATSPGSMQSSWSGAAYRPVPISINSLLIPFPPASSLHLSISVVETESVARLPSARDPGCLDKTSPIMFFFRCLPARILTDRLIISVWPLTAADSWVQSMLLRVLLREPSFFSFIFREVLQWVCFWSMVVPATAAFVDVFLEWRTHVLDRLTECVLARRYADGHF